MEKSSAIQILNSRILVSEEGKYSAKVTNIVPYTREDGQEVNIIGLAAMNSYGLGQAKEKLAAGDFQGATNTNLSRSARVGQDYTPAKGEIVDFTVGYVETKDGSQALLVTSLTPMARIKAKSVKLSLDEEVVDATAREVEVA